MPNSLKGVVVFLLGSTLMAGDSLGPDHGSMTFGKKVYLELHEQYYNVRLSVQHKLWHCRQNSSFLLRRANFVVRTELEATCCIVVLLLRPIILDLMNRGLLLLYK